VGKTIQYLVPVLTFLHCLFKTVDTRVNLQILEICHCIGFALGPALGLSIAGAGVDISTLRYSTERSRSVSW